MMTGISIEKGGIPIRTDSIDRAHCLPDFVLGHGCIRIPTEQRAGVPP